MFHGKQIVKHRNGDAVNRISTGKIGEDFAVQHLINKKYRIIHRNIHIGNIGELDIVAEKSEGFWPFSKKTLVFIEVKAIKIDVGIGKLYDPELHVDKKKQKKLIKLAQLYIARNRIKSDIPWRIDVVAVDIDSFTGNIIEVRHHENAVYPQ